MFNDPYFLMLTDLSRDLSKVNLRSALRLHVVSACQVAILQAYETHVSDMREFKNFAEVVGPSSVHTFLDKVLTVVAPMYAADLRLHDLINSKTFDAIEAFVTYASVVYPDLTDASLAVYRDYLLSVERTPHSRTASLVKEKLHTLKSEFSNVQMMMRRVSRPAMDGIDRFEFKIIEGVDHPSGVPTMELVHFVPAIIPVKRSKWEIVKDFMSFRRSVNGHATTKKGRVIKGNFSRQ